MFAFVAISHSVYPFVSIGCVGSGSGTRSGVLGLASRASCSALRRPLCLYLYIPNKIAPIAPRPRVKHKPAARPRLVEVLRDADSSGAGRLGVGGDEF